MSGRRTDGSAAKIELAAQLWSQDKMHVEIAAALGISRSAVAMMISRNRERFPERPDRHAAERQRRIDLVLPLWSTGMSVIDIADKTGLPVEAVHTITKTRRDLFPPRVKVARRARKYAAPAVGKTKSAPVPATPRPARFEVTLAEADDLPRPRLAAAFRPLSGTAPAPLWQACGCKWPVHADGTDPLTEPTLLVCDAVQMVKGRTTGGQPILAPYCATHVAMAGGEAEWRASRDRRAA